MTAYIINIVLLMLFAGVLLLQFPTKRNKKFFCAIASIQWIILSGVRHYSVGTDTLAYRMSFDDAAYTTWSLIIERLLALLTLDLSFKDPGYYFFEKIFQIFSNDYQLFLIAIALIFTVPLGIWIYKNSSEPLLSFLIYSCLFASFFAITGHRQTIATALVVLMGYQFIKDRKFISFLMLVAIAVTIHKSAICFLPFYFIANKKITKPYIAIVGILITVLFVLRNQVMFLLGTIMGYEQYIEQYEGAGTWTFTALLIMVALVSIIKFRMMEIHNPNTTHYVNAIFCALAFTPLTFIDPSAMRVVQYYSLFLMLLIPEIIRSFNSKERVLIYYFASALLIALFAKNNPQYLFFWQG